MSRNDPPTAPPDSGRSPTSALDFWNVLARAHAIVEERVSRGAAGFDLTLAEYGALETLGRHGRMLLGELQQRILVSSGGITYLVDRLAARGLVARRTNPDDRRARFAVLTEEGQRLLAEIAPQHERAVADAVDGLTRREQRQAAELLRKLELRVMETEPGAPATGAVRTAPTAAVEGARHGCILVVDDDRRTSEIIRSAVDREVLGVRTAAEAEAMLAQRQVALVVLGLVLPDADGRNVCTTLGRRAATAGIPVVMASVAVPARVKAECLGLGVAGWLDKPIDSAAIREVTVAALAASRPSDGARTDAVTGVASPVGLAEAYARDVRAQPGDAPPSALALVDWDGLAAINESHGATACEAILRQAVERLAGGLRNGDTLARWRGHEFVVLLPRTLPSMAARLLTGAQATLATSPPLTSDDHEVAITFSAGIAEATAVSLLDEAVAAADGALRRAREGGGARIVTAAEQGAHTPIRALLAESDRVTATLVRNRLQRAGFEIVHCADGPDALAAAEVSEFGLLLCDVRMPGIDGFELVSRLRATARHRDTPTLMLTGLGLEADVVRAFAAGADDYLTKPFSPVDLLARVQRLLRHRGTAAGAVEPNDIDVEARRQ